MTAEVEIRGLKDFQRALRSVDARYNNTARTIHRRVSDLVAGRARSSAPSGVSGSIKARSTNTKAFIETVPKPPYALAVLWGAKRRTGWYAKPRYAASAARQFPAWVGNQWDPGETGGQPYHIGPAINRSLDEVMAIYEDGIAEVAREAFPN